MRYLIFAYSLVGPKGGLQDLIGATNDARMAYRMIRELLPRLGKGRFGRIDWYDIKTGKVKYYVRPYVDDKILRRWTSDNRRL